MASKQQNASDEEILQAIDEIDRQLLELIQQRVELVRRCQVNHATGITGRTAEASKRIAGVVDTPHNQPTVGKASVAAILQHVSAACLQTVNPVRVAFLGPEFSYSHLAAIKYFGDAVDFEPVASIPAVFACVARGDSETGLVPIENSTDGRIVDTLGMFVRSEMTICGEVNLPIHHNLLSRTPRAQVTQIHSKPQALSQCREWLALHMPHTSLVEVSSTTAAAEHAAEQHGVAAVASLEAGRQYDLDVLNTNIEDNPNNVTRFAVLGREQPGPTGDDKTSLLFQVHHQPGALADAMTVFKDHALNLTWIESFPAPDTQNEYLFFVELAGHREDKTVAAAIEILKSTTCRLDVLGSYPRASMD